MTAKRLAVLVACLGLCLITLIVWAVRAHRTPTGGLFVTFVGLTNGNSGGILAQFDVTNAFSRRVRFGVGEVQIRQTNGWPNSMRVAGGAAWLAVAAGSHRVFSVPATLLQQAAWRVPLVYSEDLSLIQDLRFRVDGLAWSIPRWRPGRPPPVRHGDAYHRSLFAYGPNMIGQSNPSVQRAEASRSADQTNPGPEAAGFRR